MINIKHYTFFLILSFALIYQSGICVANSKDIKELVIESKVVNYLGSIPLKDSNQFLSYFLIQHIFKNTSNKVIGLYESEQNWSLNLEAEKGFILLDPFAYTPSNNLIKKEIPHYSKIARFTAIAVPGLKFSTASTIELEYKYTWDKIWIGPFTQVGSDDRVIITSNIHLN